MFIDFKDIFDLCQAQAIASKLNPDVLSVYRQYCRLYSKTFNTPLAVVRAMDPIEVITEVLEDRLDSQSAEEHAEDWLEAILSIEDPEYRSTRDKEEEEFVKQAAEEEAERIRLGKPIHPALKNESTLIPDATPTALPKSGGINLSYLEKEEQ